jgi:hypothetical protein
MRPGHLETEKKRLQSGDALLPCPLRMELVPTMTVLFAKLVGVKRTAASPG